jgi:electron transfer flavoprotein alpha subunit
MNGVLIYSERPALALELLSFATTLQAPVSAALLSEKDKTWVEEYFAYGAQRVYTSDNPALAARQADVVSEALARIVDIAGADTVLVGSTLPGREVAARLAQKLGAGCITDTVALRYEGGRLIARRYALGGNTLSEGYITSEKQVIAIMPGTFTADPVRSGKSGEVIEVPLELASSPIAVVERMRKPAAGVDVESAEVVVCAGRGLERQEDLALLQELAKSLGGVVACSRPISHDRGWLPEDQMIGISGKKISPRLYVGVGISGQIQHMVAVRGARTILAINKDKSAPIFKGADYGIVGDLYQVLPRLTEAINKAKGD